MALSTRDKTTMRLSPRTRRQWSNVLTLLKVRRPGLTVDRMLGETLRRIRLGIVREAGAAEVARILGETAKPARTSSGPPPGRPGNVH